MTDKIDAKYETQVALSSALFDNVSVARGVARRLARIGSAFNTLGNKDMADEMFAIGDALIEQAEVLIDLSGRASRADLEQSQALTGEIFGALIDSISNRDPEFAATADELKDIVVRPLIGEGVDE